MVNITLTKTSEKVYIIWRNEERKKDWSRPLLFLKN